MISNQPSTLHTARPRIRTFRGMALALVSATVFISTVFTSAVLTSGYASAGIIQTARQGTTNSNVRISVSFEKVDAKQQVILRYGAVLLKTKLKGIRLKPGAAGVLALLLPDGVRLQAEIVTKGDVQTVILTKQGININDQLLIQGVAEAIR